MKRIVNLTPHAIKVKKVGSDEFVEFKPSGYQLRLDVEEKENGVLNTVEGSVKVVKQSLKEIVLLKDGERLGEDDAKEFFRFVDGVIVPLVVAQRAEDIRKFAGREDLKVYAPNTAKAIRDSEGRILGVPNLVEF